MIISKTPLRLTLGGGGTDLPSYYSKYGGYVVSSALSSYVYVLVKKRFGELYRISYSTTEIVSSINEIKHPIIRETLKLLKVSDYLEIISIADIPSKTGLGSSGSFSVGLLKSLHKSQGEIFDTKDLAEKACKIDMEILKHPSGKQDPYIAAFGGFKILEINKNGKVTVHDLKLSNNTISELSRHLLFFYTGIRRDSSDILSIQQKSIKDNESNVIETMHKIKEIGKKVKRTLEKGDIREFGALQHEHWKAKRLITNKMTSTNIDKWYQIGLDNGAIGGKVMGAGGGGFLMFVCENGRNEIRKAMAKKGLIETNLNFEDKGSTIIFNIR